MENYILLFNNMYLYIFYDVLWFLKTREKTLSE